MAGTAAHQNSRPDPRLSRIGRWMAVALHPFLLAGYGPLFFGLHNIDELTRWQIVQPVLGCCAVGLIAAALLWALTGSARKAALLVSLASVLFFSYGHVHDTIALAMRLGENARLGRVLLPLWALIAGTGCILVLRGGSGFQRATIVVNAMALTLVLTIMASSAPRLWRTDAPEKWLDRHIPSIQATTHPIPAPDIYYIILDRYCNSAVLKELWGFENQAFLDTLSHLGFYVATQSRANYPRTFLSLGSSLNMIHFDGLDSVVASDRTPLYRAIGNNAVVRFLKAQGYHSAHLGSWWTPTRSSPLADSDEGLRLKYYRIPGPSLDEYSVKLLRTTLAYPFMARFLPIDFNDNHRRMALHQFAQLEHIATRPGPKMVFAHILLPHEPFVFGPNGEPLTPAQVESRTELTMYMDHLRYVNTRIISVVRRILAQSTQPPIIVLQADEGLWFCPNCSPTDRLRARLGILNAYYIPDSTARAALYSGISPVNTFRLVLNSLFSTGLPLLADRSYDIRDDDHPYEFTDVTGLVK